jgi:MFS family permease
MSLSFKVPAMFRALSSRNYRLFFTGQSLSLIGTWMTRLATSWLIYKLTGSALLLGTLGFASQLPTFLLGPLTGVLVDRWDRYRIMVTTQTLSMVQSFVLAILTLTGRINVPEVIALGIMQGVINAFDTPARQSFMIRMVDRKEDLSNAIALNSSMVNSARLIGPSIAGVLIAAVGLGWCFFWDGVSYMAVIASLLLMRLSPSKKTRGARSGAVTDFVEGFQYVSGMRSIRSILAMLALISLVGMPYTVLLPLFATALGGGAKTLGYLMSAVGVGALIGAISLAARKSVIGLGRVVGVAAAIFGGGLILFALSHVLWLSMAMLVITGYGFISQLASSNTLIQTISDESKRGRVMAFYTMAFMGTAPFGSLLAGVMAHWFGAPHTIMLGGVLCLLGSAWFASQLPAIRDELRPVYSKLGIIEEPPAEKPVDVDGIPSPAGDPALVGQEDEAS